MHRTPESFSIATAAMYYIAIAAVMIASLQARGRGSLASELAMGDAVYFYALAHAALVYGLLHLLIEGARRIPGITQRSFLLLSNGLFAAVWAGLAVHLVVFMRFGSAIDRKIISLMMEPGFFVTIGIGVIEIAGMILVLACMYGAFLGLAVLTNRVGPRCRLLWVLLPCLAIGGAGRVAFGLQEFRSPGALAGIGERLPFHGYTRLDRLGEWVGIEPQVEGAGAFDLEIPVSPSKNVHIQPPGGGPIAAANDYNVLYIMVESLRFDMLDPVIMPNVSALAADPKSFRGMSHFSTGNSTAESMFGIFSGLSALHWSTGSSGVLGYPAIFEIYERMGYELNLFYTSKPPFRGIDRYVLPTERMNTQVFADRKKAETREIWKARPLELDDIDAVDALLESLDQRDPGKFVDILYLYATHYNYYYTTQDELFLPTLERNIVFYSLFTREHPEGLFNRYKNASHFVDRMTQRVIDRLESLDLLEKTIIVFVGDHGEEFQEFGRIGHSTAVNRFQTQVPLVIRAPQGLKSQYTTTSHSDLSPTLLSLLGADLDIPDYFGGKDLARFEPDRDYAVITDPLGSKVSRLYDMHKKDGPGKTEAFDHTLGRFLLVENGDKLHFEVGRQVRPLFYVGADDQETERPIGDASFARLREIIGAEAKFFERYAPAARERALPLPKPGDQRIWRGLQERARLDERRAEAAGKGAAKAVEKSN